MKYIIPINVKKELEESEQYEKALKKFLDKIKGYNLTFEIFNSKEERNTSLQIVSTNKIVDAVRFCTTMRNNCIENTKITGYDLDIISKTFFVEVTTENDDFNPKGEFVTRDFYQYNKENPSNMSKNVQIVGIDYILKKGEIRDENQS